MPYLATSRTGIAAFTALECQGLHLWLGSDVVSEEELQLLRAQGHSVSVFSHPVRTLEAIENSIPTVVEHHPNEALWVQPPIERSNPDSSSIGAAFLWNEPIVGVSFPHNHLVEVVSGPYARQRGSLVTVLTLSPEPTYVVELESGYDVEILQSCLRDAGV